jgi:predicted ATPase
LDTPVICPTFIGRTRERATLGALLDAVTHKQGRAATISGEAGIGKSRLVAETKRAALAQGFLIVQGQCFQADAMYPYAPLLDLLRGYLPDRLSAIVAGGQEPLARELVQLLPDLSLLFPQFTQPAPSQTAEHANAAQQQHRLFAILTHLLASEVAIGATRAASIFYCILRVECAIRRYSCYSPTVTKRSHRD